jgi:hypothetical protein
MIVESDPLNQTTAGVYRAVRSRVVPRLNLLAACRSQRELLAHPVYRELAPLVEEALATTYVADFRRGPAPPRPRYRVVAWNIERGRQFPAQLELFRSHPYLSQADVVLLTEADAGMARSGNQMVAEALARELGMAVAFAPCYIAFGKGSGVERDTGGENTFALHGNALLSRYPISGVRQIPLVNGVDKIAHRAHRIPQSHHRSRERAPGRSIHPAPPLPADARHPGRGSRPRPGHPRRRLEYQHLRFLSRPLGHPGLLAARHDGRRSCHPQPLPAPRTQV